MLDNSEFKKARQARAAARRELFGDRLRQALGLDKTAAESWNIEEFDIDHHPLGDMHPGASAVMYVREALSNFDIPSKVGLQYTGMKRKSGSGAHQLKDGVVWVEATFRSISGVKHSIDVPVMVHAGHMVYPEVLVHNGRPRVMAQSTFDEIIDGSEVYRKVNDRKHVYSSPPDEVEQARHRMTPETPQASTGIFGLTAALRGYRKDAQLTSEQTQAYEQEWQGGRSLQSVLEEVESLLQLRGPIPELQRIKSALEDLIAQEGQGKVACIDEAERDRREYCKPGEEITLSNDVTLLGRGGTKFTIAGGTKGTVLRDMFGTGDVYYVQLENGCKAPINKGDIA